MLVVAMLMACSSQSPKDDSQSSPSSTVIPSTSTSSTVVTTGDAAQISAEIGSYDWVTEVGQPVRVEGVVASSAGGEVTLSWSSDLDGILLEESLASGEQSALLTSSLSPGWHALTLYGSQDGQSARDEVDVGVCTWPALEPFDSSGSLAGWTTYGDASWDPGGWIEITGNAPSRSGQLFRTDAKVNPGDVAIEFSIATGGGVNGGADGFAVSVIAAYDVTELSSIVNAAGVGGCLGYGVAGPCGPMLVSAFHVEFDTWYNPELGDTTVDNHVSIAINGDPTPLFTAVVPSLEDLAWRDIRVEIVSSDITVLMDGALIIAGTIPGFTFDGGYIGVSGSTGWATNFHRFDNLQLYDICEIPGTTSTP